MLTTAKSGFFVHTSHRAIASLRRKAPDPSVEISPELAAARGVSAGDWIRLRTRHGTARLRARLNAALDTRTVVAEFNGERIAVRSWPAGENRSVVAELHY